MFDYLYNDFQTPQDAECDAFMSVFRTNVEKLMERMKYLAGKGRHISKDSIAQVRNIDGGHLSSIFINFELVQVLIRARHHSHSHEDES
jgi:hypothetical protein